MFYRKVLYTIILQLAFCAFLTGSVKAEGNESLQDIRQNIPEEYLQKISKELKLPPNSRHLKRLFSQTSDSIPPEGKYPQTILKHIKGDSGERFATEDEITNEIAKIYKNKPRTSSKRRVESSYEKPKDTPKKDMFNKAELLDLTASMNTQMPVCSKSITVKEKVTDPDITESDDIIYDFIVLNPNTPLPKDVKTAFGKNVIIVFYSNSKNDQFSQYLTKFNVTCLPARLRSTGKFMFRDEGLNALKNYDKDFYGRGVLDQRVLSEMKMK